ncbi:uncharacterized protein LOC143254896, partial [Tachypleus tridentatus]|uniref:uncharacterized protein LOC143254896 n=1 Tax=Tachypleus tridentatus TaxID=6853 RepID=UPI003FD58E92
CHWYQERPSPLLFLSFSTFISLVSEYMHCVLLGVVRMLVFLWLNSKHHRTLWYTGRTDEQVKLVLRRFVKETNIVYGQCHITINIHFLLHILEISLLLGTTVVDYFHV